MRLVTYRVGDGAPRVGDLGPEGVRDLRAPSMVAWLAGEGREPTGVVHPVDAVRLLAPVPEPPSVRDFYAFEGHVAAGWRRRGADIPEHWYAEPVFYFSNPASIRGPGEPVRRPSGTRMLDFELEIAAVVGAGGELAGFTLMNDWSARDLQRREMTVLLGPSKAKDFATSMGPWLVTPDELPYRDGRLHLEARVLLDGVEIGRGHAARQRFGWPEILAHAARDTRLRPGDVLGSGTLDRGCLLELGPLEGGEGWIEPGHVVTLEAEGLGALETPVV
jgi:fumarylacetoacetate (FAA) hydrolase